MINLLPDHAKRTITLERRLRLAAVSLIILSLVIAALCVFLLPTSIMPDAYMGGEDTAASSLSLVNERLAETEKELATTKTVIDHRSKADESRNQSALIAEFDQLGGENIRLRQFVFDDNSRLLLSGGAAARFDLSSFRDRLQKTEKFTKVEQP